MNFQTFLALQKGTENFAAGLESLWFTNKNGKKFVLLFEDISECLRSIWEHGDQINKEFKGDWTYEETKYRDGLGKHLTALSPNSVSANLGSQTPNTVKSLEMYAAYMLGGFNLTEIEPSASILSKQYLDQLFVPSERKIAFQQWLETTGRKPKSAQSYAGAIAGILSRIAGHDLFEIVNPAQFEKEVSEIGHNAEYIEINKNGNGMYRAALSNYSKFLSFAGLESKFEIFDIETCPKIVILSGIIQSLLAKPFAILTGASGTGKTKLAEAIAEHFRNHEEVFEATNYAIVPVGADWTDNRNVLGFVNHLREDGLEDKRPIYQSTKVLDLLLEANNTPSVPYFLILDEMNLSHVERYFADFLSTMEQKNGELSLHDEGPREGFEYTLPRFSGDTDGIPRKLRYPKNLFVIGTVNVDETTYMFSPKVLDRANVIEFNVTENDIASFLNEPGGYPPAEKAADGTAEAFLALALKAQNDSPDEGLEPLPDSVKTQANTHILKFFTILKAGRFEFAFRSSKEVLRYLRICRHLSGNQADWDSADWKADLDDQVLQKLLPKLHGSVGRIGGLLAELAHYCATGEPRAEDAASLNLKDVLLLSEDGAAFPRSLKKLRSMVDTLLDEQFVSFVH
ncbi:hypothetical protein N9K67_06060 [Opitutaceae bacterium]|nr:hypothetical protein [Opitutaceae bacterium]